MNRKLWIRKGEGRDYDYSQDHCYVKVSSDQTNGELCCVEDHLKPGFCLGRHHHKKMTEIFYILEGETQFAFDDETIIAKPGDTITIPPNVWHAVNCIEGGKLITIFKEGQFDRYLERLSKMTDAEFADKKLMTKLANQFDIYED